MRGRGGSRWSAGDWATTADPGNRVGGIAAWWARGGMMVRRVACLMAAHLKTGTGEYMFRRAA